MGNAKWVYHNPVFEADAYNPELMRYAPWAGLREFAYDYISCMQPALIVELGSHYGCSSFAFLQAIKDHSPDSVFWAVDTWQGDDFTKNDYTEDVYSAYKKVNDSCFSSADSRMLRKTFDAAVADFTDQSIDLLHIDGSHQYEDVRRDYETWLPKLRPDGVIFFHDVGEDLMFGTTMGSHLFWEELKRTHPYTAELPFSNGLGILFLDEQIWRRFDHMVDFGVYQHRLNLQDTNNKAVIRENFFVIRDLKQYNADLLRQIQVLREHLDAYSRDTQSAQSYIRELEERCALLHSGMAAQNAELEQLRDDVLALRESKEKCYELIAQKQEQLSQLDMFTQQKDAYSRALQEDLRRLQDFLGEKERWIGDLEEQRESLRIYAEGKKRYAQELLNDKEQLMALLDAKEAYITSLEQQRNELAAFADGKDSYARTLETSLEQLRAERDNTSIQNIQLRESLQDREEVLEQMNADAAILCGRIDRIPFGGKLLEGLTVIGRR